MQSNKTQKNLNPRQRSLCTLSTAHKVLGTSTESCNICVMEGLQSSLSLNDKLTSRTKYYSKFTPNEVPDKPNKDKEEDENDNTLLQIETRNESISLDNQLSINYILEQKSKELQTDSSFDSVNIKFFKMTVEEILSRFYANMEDFNQYKQRYQEIISKNDAEKVDTMENFLKDVLSNIKSNNDVTKGLTELEINKKEISVENLGQYSSCNTSSNSKTYTVDSMESGGINNNVVESEANIKIKKNDRNHLSQININSERPKNERRTFSTNNLKQVNERKSLILTTTHDFPENKLQEEKEIPIRNATAKNDIFTGETSNSNTNTDIDEGILFRLCRFLCKKWKRQ